MLLRHGGGSGVFGLRGVVAEFPSVPGLAVVVVALIFLWGRAAAAV
jgi:hypothetical protein